MSQKERIDHGALAFGVADKLERRFGLGAQPTLRRALFERLQLAVEVHGERAFRSLKTVAAEAAGKRKPDRYFCRAALCRLREEGLMPMVTDL